MEVGIQGVLGSFHDQAASKYFKGKELDIKAFHDFRSLAKAIAEKQLDYGVMAIENTIAGSILPNYSLMNEFDLKVTGEVYIRIEMNLIGHAGKKAEDLNQVFSHPMALLQCADFLSQYPNMKLTEYDDTADSVRMIKEAGLTQAGAIASKKAAELFEMDILDENIETNKLNYTRFLIMKSRMNGHNSKPKKASLRIMTKHDPGRLSDVLVVFKEHKINLTKIQSMPVLGQPYRYAFNIDVVWEDYSAYQAAMKAIEKSTESIIVHGEYDKGVMPDYDKGSR
ncbi:prephenate dehydratase [Reichenbachiella ulvae]|uniref:prephenate dehydratase n=1 Tax=Reichenbachiella ulvae TaxID=2980104 RepID=A0ABT3CRW1_9BACT|nr:prephenate dehydratase [Reichenbachiella ulvae]MCV9386357.1 prephenate dehydratase [Reichenbachiella ulvae]